MKDAIIYQIGRDLIKLAIFMACFGAVGALSVALAIWWLS